MAEVLTCTSCKRRVANLKGISKFPCPKCDNSQIIRCRHCREIVAKYTCRACGFVGPN